MFIAEVIKASGAAGWKAIRLELSSPGNRKVRRSLLGFRLSKGEELATSIEQQGRTDSRLRRVDAVESRGREREGANQTRNSRCLGMPADYG